MQRGLFLLAFLLGIIFPSRSRDRTIIGKAFCRKGKVNRSPWSFAAPVTSKQKVLAICRIMKL